MREKQETKGKIYKGEQKEDTLKKENAKNEGEIPKEMGENTEKGKSTNTKRGKEYQEEKRRERGDS